MKFFIDTANVEEIKKANDMGIICGVTTNPSLIAKEANVKHMILTHFWPEEKYEKIQKIGDKGSKRNCSNTS